MQPARNYETIIDGLPESVEEQQEHRVRNCVEDLFLYVAQLGFFFCGVGSFANGEAWKGAGSVCGLGAAFVIHDCLRRTR